MMSFHIPCVPGSAQMYVLTLHGGLLDKLQTSLSMVWGVRFYLAHKICAANSFCMAMMNC